MSPANSSMPYRTTRLKGQDVLAFACTGQKKMQRAHTHTLTQLDDHLRNIFLPGSTQE